MSQIVCLNAVCDLGNDFFIQTAGVMAYMDILVFIRLKYRDEYAS
jgi:hypothetical protein